MSDPDTFGSLQVNDEVAVTLVTADPVAAPTPASVEQGDERPSAARRPDPIGVFLTLSHTLTAMLLKRTFTRV